MKLRGKETIGLKQEQLKVTRNIVGSNSNSTEETYTFLLTALPLGSEDEIERELPSPKPPQKGHSRDHNNKIMRDSAGVPIPFYDKYDPDFLEQSRKVSKLQTTAMMYRCLARDPNIEWESKVADFKSKIEFYEAIYKEFITFGLSMGEMAQLINKMLSVSQLLPEDFKEARDSFLSDAK